MGLSKSQAHYIKAVYELSVEKSTVRICDIAERLNFSKASASTAITKLEQKGLMYKDAERHVYLTPEGEREAIGVMDKYAMIHTFLVDVLGVEKTAADEDACAIEHVVSLDTLCAFCRYSNQSKGKRQCPKECVIHYRDDKVQ